jgi:hypothetical protein
MRGVNKVFDEEVGERKAEAHEGTDEVKNKQGKGTGNITYDCCYNTTFLFLLFLL